MFRLSGLPQIDAAEEKRRVRENVKSNIFSFVLLCAAIRIGKQLIWKITNHQMDHYVFHFEKCEIHFEVIGMKHLHLLN